MPSKIDDFSNVQFLYACLESASPNRIDYAEVAKKFNIQTPAARMRLHRLRNDLGGKPTAKVSKAKSVAASRCRLGKGKKTAKEGLETEWRGMDDGDDDEEIAVAVGKVEGCDEEVKKEEEDGEGGNAWKKLPEAVVGGSSGVQAQIYGAYDQVAMVPPPIAPAYQTTGQSQSQVSFRGEAVPGTIKREDDFFDLLKEYAQASSEVAIPQTAYDEVFPLDPSLCQYTLQPQNDQGQ